MSLMKLIIGPEGERVTREICREEIIKGKSFAKEPSGASLVLEKHTFSKFQVSLLELDGLPSEWQGHAIRAVPHSKIIIY